MPQLKPRSILQSLVDGNNPFTGAPIPPKPETLLNNLEVVRALLAGVNALDKVSAREQRRAQLPKNVGSLWTDEEEQRLTTAFRAGDSLKNLAAQHGRTTTAIEARLVQLGLVKPEERRHESRFISSRGAAERPRGDRGRKRRRTHQS